jgi:hypothetical protein
VTAPATARMAEGTIALCEALFLRVFAPESVAFKLLAEARRARGREEAMEKALGEIAHPESAKDGYLDNCPGCIARAVLERKPQP